MTGKRIQTWAVGWLGCGLLRAMRATWRMRLEDPHDVVPGLRSASPPGIMAFWHRQILTMVSEFGSHRISVPVSEHQDGEYIAQVIRRFGARTVRGSTTRGAVRVLRGMLRDAEAGCTLAITPDGPRGPCHSVQPGVAMLAQRSGLPVVPFTVTVDRAWTARSWDRFVIPKPGARIVITAGEPLSWSEHPDIDEFCAALRKRMLPGEDGTRTDAD
jgi:lysophospholipid acyltransferase (LPLAT)-like uncharacterized protein